MENVTVIMTTHRNNDFTLSSLYFLFRHYPDIKVILADSTPVGYIRESNGMPLEILCEQYFEKQYRNIKVLRFGEKTCAEDCRNAAAQMVDTEYILFMDNDTKILSKDAIDICLKPFEKDSKIVQTGAYALKIFDRKNNVSFVGKNFKENVIVDAMPCFFSLHKTSAFKYIGGFPKRFFYKVPEEIVADNEPGYSGDFSITDEYKNLGCYAVTPVCPVPVLHWGQANRWFNVGRPVEDWWYKNTKHITIDPFTNKAIEEAREFYR